jgi:uncharacterized protein (DUF1015 family)
VATGFTFGSVPARQGRDVVAGVRAFRALRFTPEAGDLADLIAPPYDVIDAAQRERLGSKSPFNIVNLTLPLGEADPAEPGNRYECAGALISDWKEKGILTHEAEPSLTVLREEFRVDCRECRRTGVQAAVRLGRYGEGEISPHERTLDGPRADRLALVRATKANLSSVFLLVSDGSGEVRECLAEITAREPDHDVQGPDEARRLVWFEREAATIERLQESLSGLAAVIADGHHRYETALAYRDELAGGQGGPGEAAHVLCHVVPVEDEGLVVLPTHRTVTPKRAADAEKLVAALRAKFALEEVSREEAAVYAASPPATGDAQGFCVVLGRPARVLRAELRDAAEMIARAPEHHPAWRALDVPCLHLLVIEDILGIAHEEVAAGGRVKYSRDAGETISAVESEGGIGFILRPTPPEAVLDVARAGERMPQKSTYFYPKVAAGLTMRSLR